MKSKRADWLRGLGVLATVVLLSGAALADSSVIAYQGVLRTAGGPAVPDGAYDMVFSLWDADAAGTELWAENHAGVSIADGEFAVPLGATTAFGTVFADHASLWLQIAVDTGSGVQVYDPRIPLTSVPYAKAAATADSADTAATATHATNADSATEATHAGTADTAANANNATNANNAATLGGQPPAAFAAASHPHDASAINAGTLSTDRYSAYADLGAESKIGAAGTQVAAGDHRHTSRPYWVGTVGGETSGTKSLVTQQNYLIPIVPSGSGHALVAPIAGRYLVHFQQLTNANPGATYLSMRHNGGATPLAYSWINGGRQEDMIVQEIVNMNAGDTITFTVDSVVQGYAWGGTHSSVSMFLIGQL